MAKIPTDQIMAEDLILFTLIGVFLTMIGIDLS